MYSLRRMIRFVKPYWKASALALLLLVSVVAMDLTIPRLIQRIIDEGIARHDLTTVWTTALLMLGAAVLSTLLMIANTLLAVRVAQYFAADVRSALFRQVQALSFGNLDRLQTGQLMIRLTSDVNQVQLIVMLALRILTRAPLMLVGSVILLILTSWQLALLMLVLLPITGVVIWAFIAKTQPLFLGVQRRLGYLNTVLQENLAGVRVVKAFVRAEHENARFEQANAALTDQNTRVMQIMSLLMPTMMFLINAGIAAVIWFGGVQVNSGTLTVGAVVAFVKILLANSVQL